MKVSEVPFDKLSVGDIVISDFTKHRGTIVELVWHDDPDYRFVTVRWPNNMSWHPHYEYTKVEYYESVSKNP